MATTTQLFRDEALQVIWDEIDRMYQEDERAIGVAFDDPGVRREVYVFYVDEASNYTLQPKKYRYALWKPITFCMQFINSACTVHGHDDVVDFHEDYWTTRCTIFPMKDEDGSSHTLAKIFHRVDNMLTLMAAPLRGVENKVLRATLCPTCNTALVPKDGNPGQLRCPNNCSLL